MAGTSAQDAWVERVLGLALGGGGQAQRLQAAARAPLKVVPIAPAIRHASVGGLAQWTAARDGIWDRFEALQSAMLDTGEPGTSAIASHALPELSRRLGVRLVAALTEVDVVAPADAPAARARALRAVADTRALLMSDGLVKLLDGNAFGVSMAVASTLGGALDRIEQVLRV